MGNVDVLPLLGTAAEQQNDALAMPREVDPISRPMMNAQFADAIAKAFDIAHVAQGEPLDTYVNVSDGAIVLQAIEPARKFQGLSNFQHVCNLVHNEEAVKGLVRKADG